MKKLGWFFSPQLFFVLCGSSFEKLLNNIIKSKQYYMYVVKIIPF